MHRSQKLLLRPTAKQAKLFKGAAGLARLTWNWAVALTARHYALYGKQPGYKRPQTYRLNKFWNRIKRRRYPWADDYSTLIPQQSFTELDTAYARAFTMYRKTGRFSPPAFRKKGRKESFQCSPVSAKNIGRRGRSFNIPRVGYVRSVTKLRWPDAKQVKGRVKLVGDRWWLIFAYNLEDPAIPKRSKKSCGIDLGVRNFATVSSSGVIVQQAEPFRSPAKIKRRIKRLQRKFARQKKGSKRRERTKVLLGKSHRVIRHKREDYLHKLSIDLVRRYTTITLEDLDVQAMDKGFLRGRILELGLAKFRTFIEYKAAAIGTKVIIADRYYASSKTCCRCGIVKSDLKLADRVFRCKCGYVADRDHNAAINLEYLPAGYGKTKLMENVKSPSRKGRGRRSEK